MPAAKLTFVWILKRCVNADYFWKMYLYWHCYDVVFHLMQHQLHMYDIVLLERQFKLYFIHKHISGENWIDRIYPAGRRDGIFDVRQNRRFPRLRPPSGDRKWLQWINTWSHFWDLILVVYSDKMIKFHFNNKKVKICFVFEYVFPFSRYFAFNRIPK